MKLRRTGRRATADLSTCTSASKVTTAGLLLSFLAFSTTSLATAPHDARRPNNAQQAVLPSGPGTPGPARPDLVAPAQHAFTLRNIFHHGTHRQPRLHRRMDIPADTAIRLAAEDGYEAYNIPATLPARSRGSKIQRLVDRRPSVVDPMVEMARRDGSVLALAPDAWSVDEVPSPDVTDKATVLSLALMASNAYVEGPGEPDWEDVGAPFNRSADFGWENDGLRGHVYADENNSTVVIGLKGTSMAVFDGDGTTTNDKVNDNLFFSCCCAQQGPWTWHQVCDCATGTYSCNNTCVVKALREENRYYAAVRELYSNVTELFPDSTVWVAGHSLGGAVSSMLGLTYGLPVVTFEAVPEALAAGRLGLPVPPGSDPDNPQTREDTGIFHFGHTADPVYVGTCNGATASCSFGGYALETACHAGRECVYDVVADKGWRVGIGTHKIRTVIHDVILKYDSVPECVFTPECRDCANWKFYESNGTETTTSSTTTSTKTRTRTETCKTPGWWGCLDETTTTGDATTTSTTTTTTTTTSTCKTPGWFGCKDTTTTASTTIARAPSATSEPTSVPVRTTTNMPTETSTTAATSTPCHTLGRFWGCWDKTTSTTDALPHSITAPPTEL